MTSVWGLSFLVVLVNAALADTLNIILDRFVRKRKTRDKTFAAYSLPIALTAVVGIYLWGATQLKPPDAHGLLKVALIQGNIPQYQKWKTRYRDTILERYQRMTSAAATDNPDLIVWPESATPGHMNTDRELYKTVTSLVRETGIPLLLGTSSQEKHLKEKKKQFRLQNSALLIDEAGEIPFIYNKIRLLPFGEYPPLADLFTWPRWLVPKEGRFLAGNDYTLFELGSYRFGVVICWEVFFGDLFRTFVKHDAQFMVNLANEAWFEGSQASRQLLAMTVFRAVENRVALLRATNTGISGLIDPFGRIRAMITDDRGNDIMVQGRLTVTVPKHAKPSFYTSHGDIFPLTVSGLAFVMLAWAGLSSPQPRTRHDHV